MIQLGAWIIIGLLAAADNPSPANLVRRLGSNRFSDRVEAARALERLGTRAISDLRTAEHSGDARVRARVPGLIEAIERGAERARFEQPTELQLDFRDRPLSEVIEALNNRYHLPLAVQFGPATMPGMRMRFPMQGRQADPRLAEAEARKVTIVSDHPLPFWKAIDRICEAGQLRHDLHPGSVFDPTNGWFVLHAGLPGGRPVVSDSGPIRVKITGLRATIERKPSVTSSPPRGSLMIRMVVIPEPGLVVRPAGPIAITEAVDDLGRKRNASAASPPNNVYQVPFLAGYSGFEAVATLAIDDLGSRSLRRLHGSIPAVMVARTPSPLVFPLDQKAPGQSGRIDGATVRILEVSTGANDEVSSVLIEVTSDRPQVTRFRPWNPSQPPDLATFQVDQALNRVELLDAQGHPIAIRGNPSQSPNFMARRFQLIPNPFGPAIAQGPPVILRFHGLVQQKTEIAFDFHDVPMP